MKLRDECNSISEISFAKANKNSENICQGKPLECHIKVNDLRITVWTKWQSSSQFGDEWMQSLKGNRYRQRRVDGREIRLDLKPQNLLNSLPYHI